MASLALKTNSPYTPFLKKVILQIIDSGQLQRLMTQYNSEEICDPFLEDAGTPLSLKKLFLLYLIISLGMMFSILLLVFEISKGSKHSNQVKSSRLKASKIPRPIMSRGKNIIRNP